MKDQQTQISKFLSLVLRHQPEAIGLQLDQDGGADVDELLRCAARHQHPITHTQLLEVVANNDKKHFTLSADQRRIRAAQGHSTQQVAMRHEAKTPPEFLYHGTASRSVAAIFEEGLKPGQRHHAHLSSNIETATRVGARHGTPVVLRIPALQLHQQGMAFFSGRQRSLAQRAHCPPIPTEPLKWLPISARDFVHADESDKAQLQNPRRNPPSP